MLYLEKINHIIMLTSKMSEAKKHRFYVISCHLPLGFIHSATEQIYSMLRLEHTLDLHGL